MMHTSAKAALGTYTNLAAECKVLPEDSEYIEKLHTEKEKHYGAYLFCKTRTNYLECGK
ncbi:MAG: hypothetical protein HDT30_10205 [Clostridiales bacterium]|nr:hypothetical protein [Clostridiales bacterium]